MKLLKNATYQVMQNRIKMLEKDLEDQLNEVGSLRPIVKTKNLIIERITETNKILEEIVGMADNQIASLKPKAEKWDAELKRHALKSKIARIKKMSAKQLATKYIDFECEGIKGIGKICGYDEDDIVIGLKNNKGWIKEACIGQIMKEHASYTLVNLFEVKTQIINSLK